jgi:NAD(P)-dependent dehydrogenase (short-subunit alcohol dehydrogenase family)
MNTIIMTGGTFGLGEATAKRLNAAPDTQLIIGGRETRLPLELASLGSIRQFARQVLDTLGTTRINALVLNAGLSFPTAARTVDGYETTFAIC